MGVNELDLAHTLADAFNTLADEVQTLADRRTVLEHKLRFAHEQFQYLADKYAPAAPEIAETLANLQLPPPAPVDENTSVPLPQKATPTSQHQLALVIRDGRRMASQLASLRETSKTTDSSRVTYSQTSKSHQTSISTQLEHDYTVEGRKGDLQCPFTKISSPSDNAEDVAPSNGSQNHVPHPPSDPICAAMFEESTSQAGTNATAGIKCPIRFMDKHSPEEIANYVEAHKHELPRSHEVCLRRYQKNEQQIRKLDSKYGNVVSMIEGLSQLHQPMLPEDAEDAQRQVVADGASNERVETWAQAISATTDPDAEQEQQEVDPERDGHFDRPLKEVRVGESPSRPWGISVPVPDTYSGHDLPMSPPPAPVHMPRLTPPDAGASKPAGKCPFDHTKLSAMAGLTSDTKLNPDMSPGPQASYGGPPPVTPLKQAPQLHASAPSPSYQQQHTQVPPQPTFINPGMSQVTAGGQAPQMVFTGPVFIGYPIEQAFQFMNQYQRPQ
ncbi:hypothetical protein NLU13_3193 [Sarocladium strictum]|uniref:Uncharacterized protein n=1 Tax=Sarocladium strictum TaxID=5046 RepID=A0AA39GLJ4_SARSR|nr:hypothetical protein NLU13_3193 [Sarocladium strictum]